MSPQGLVILGGLPGTGKTSIGRELALALGAVFIRIDSIEHAIWASGVTRRMDDAGYRVGYALAEDNLRLGHTVVADSVNPIEITRRAWREAAARAGAPAWEIEIVCSDALEHRRRVESRASEIPGFVTPSWQEVVDREYEPWTGARLVVDTARKSVTRSVEDIRAALVRSGGQ